MSQKEPVEAMVFFSPKKKELHIPKGASYSVRHEGDKTIISYEETPEEPPKVNYKELKYAAFAGRFLRKLAKLLIKELLAEEMPKRVNGQRID